MGLSAGSTLSGAALGEIDAEEHQRAADEQVKRHALAREQNLAVLWATHLIDEIDGGDDIVVLHKGRVVERGKAREVVKRAGAGSLAQAFDGLTNESGEEAR